LRNLYRRESEGVRETGRLRLVDETLEYEKTPGGPVKIPFNIVGDLFSHSSAAKFAEASERLIMSHIHGYLRPVEDAIEAILQSVK
jgi:hypothetical protein